MVRDKQLGQGNSEEFSDGLQWLLTWPRTAQPKVSKMAVLAVELPALGITVGSLKEHPS